MSQYDLIVICVSAGCVVGGIITAIMCQVTGGVTYVPIPSGASQNLAGLLTIDLPQTVVTGQEFNIILYRLVTRRFIEPPPPRIASREVLAARNKNHARAPRPINWRYIAGTFQVKIPVSTAASNLPWNKTAGDFN